MQISNKHKIAFLCLPQCESTSIENVLHPYCEINLGGHPSIKHINARIYHKNIRPLLKFADPQNKIETFCMMREPMDWVRSWYSYRAQKQLKNRKSFTGNIDFIHFVEAYLSKYPPAYAQIGTQLKFMRLPDGSLGVNRIFRTDQMSQVSEYLALKLGEPVQIPVANQSADVKRKIKNIKDASTPDVSSELPDELLARLKDHLTEDYSLYESLQKI